jgi:hypothetical protein
MIHHSSRPLPFMPLDQWPPSWPQVSALPKPDPSWFAYPSNPACPPRRRPYFRLEPTVANPSTSRPLHPRARAYPHAQQLRAQVAPLPALPIALSIPGLEREYLFWVSPACIYSASQHRPCPPRIPDRRCQRQRHPHLRRNFSMWCAMRHYWHPSRFHIDHLRFSIILNFPIQMRISRTRRTPDRNESEHKTDRTTLLFLSDGPPSPYYAASTV